MFIRIFLTILAMPSDPETRYVNQTKPTRPIGPLSSYCPRILQENSGFFIKKWSKIVIFDKFGKCSSKNHE